MLRTGDSCEMRRTSILALELMELNVLLNLPNIAILSNLISIETFNNRGWGYDRPGNLRELIEEDIKNGV